SHPTSLTRCLPLPSKSLPRAVLCRVRLRSHRLARPGRFAMSLRPKPRSDRTAASCRFEGKMPNFDLNADYPYRGDYPQSSEPDNDQNELKGILDAIASQLSDADRRHSATLSEMQHLIAGMERETGVLRDHVPQQFASTFARIETGVSELAQRMECVNG